MHNTTWPVNLFDDSNVEVGKYTYGPLCVFSGADNTKLKIGHYCSLAHEITFLLGIDHRIDIMSTFPLKDKILKNKKADMITKGNIIIDDDVWIGYGATIMSGVHVGQGSVIAAGAVVTKDVPPYSIVGGVPAKVIKYRFSPDLIEELLKVDYSKLTQEMIEEHIDDLYKELKTPQQLEWMPKKG